MSQKALAVESFRIDLGNGLHLSGETRAVADGVRKPVLVLGHGFRGHRRWGFWPDVAGRFAEEGFYTVSFDFSRIGAKNDGLGEAEQDAASTLSRELEEWGTVLAHLRGVGLPLCEEADPARIAVLGHSRAGGSGILFAAGHPAVNAVVVWNGGAGAPDQEERYDVKRHFAGLAIPALIVQGDADQERLLDANRGLRAAAPSQTFVSLAGADHVFGTTDPYAGSTGHLDEAFAHTVAFLNRRWGADPR